MSAIFLGVIALAVAWTERREPALVAGFVLIAVVLIVGGGIAAALT